MQRLSGTGHVELPPDDRLRALTVLDGAVSVRYEDYTPVIGRGRTAALPANLGPISVDLEEAHAMLSALA